MADTPEKILKKLDKRILFKQIGTADDIIKQSQQQILKLQAQIQQQLGLVAFAKHLLDQYEIPDPEASSERREDETVKS